MHRWRSPWCFWLGWTLANGGGGAIIGALEAGGLQFFATLVLTGPVLGLVQGLWLWRSRVVLTLWVLLSAIGWLLGVQLHIVTRGGFDPVLTWLTNIRSDQGILWLNLITEAVAALGLSLAQWLILRRYLPGAEVWISISILSGAVHGAVSAIVCGLVCPQITRSLNAVLATAIAYGAGWMSYGAITGGLLVKLDQHRASH